MEVLQPFAQEALDALDAQVAVLDEEGAIIGCNRRWRDAGHQVNAPGRPGANYVESTGWSARRGDPRAQRAEKGLRRLIGGEIESFDATFRVGRRFIRLRARTVCQSPARFIVLHEDITAVLRARQERDHAHSELATARREHAGRIESAYEELGQRLAAITLSAQAIKRAGLAAASVATILLAVDEAKRELRLLRDAAISGPPAASGK